MQIWSCQSQITQITQITHHTLYVTDTALTTSNSPLPSAADLVVVATLPLLACSMPIILRIGRKPTVYIDNYFARPSQLLQKEVRFDSTPNDNLTRYTN
jgi:hypothetical protein